MLEDDVYTSMPRDHVLGQPEGADAYDLVRSNGGSGTAVEGSVSYMSIKYISQVFPHPIRPPGITRGGE